MSRIVCICMASEQNFLPIVVVSANWISATHRQSSELTIVSESQTQKRKTVQAYLFQQVSLSLRSSASARSSISILTARTATQTKIKRSLTRSLFSATRSSNKSCRMLKRGASSARTRSKCSWVHGGAGGIGGAAAVGQGGSMLLKRALRVIFELLSL